MARLGRCFKTSVFGSLPVLHAQCRKASWVDDRQESALRWNEESMV